MAFQMAEINVLRGNLDHQRITQTINNRRAWQRQQHSQYQWRGYIPILDHVEKDLHALCDVLLSASSPYKLVVSAQSGWIYTNDVTLLKQLSNLPYIVSKFYTSVYIDRPRDTIKLKNSTHKFRGYFRAQRLTDEERVKLKNFLSNYQDVVRLSPALMHWKNRSRNWLSEHYFLDYSEQQWQLMLALVHPKLIRKTLDIITN